MSSGGHYCSSLESAALRRYLERALSERQEFPIHFPGEFVDV